MKHHTKSKGDIAVGYTIANLFANGFSVCLPVSEHLPFDLIAVNEQCEVARVQVKYTRLKKKRLVLKLRSSYANRKGVFTKTIDRNMIDGYSIYCPDLDKVFYVGKSFIPSKSVNSYSVNPTVGKWTPDCLFGR